LPCRSSSAAAGGRTPSGRRRRLPTVIVRPAMRARYARPGDCFEVLRFVQPKPAFGSRRADCFGERVLRIALGGGGERQQTFAVDRVVEGDHIGDPGRPKVRVPVLSISTISALANDSRYLPPLMRSPRRAEAPHHRRHVTRMTLIIPPSWWSRMWQWNIQSPGLSATNAISARSRGGISIVSRHSRYLVGRPFRMITRNE
jgi:hypothetical protein